MSSTERKNGEIVWQAFCNMEFGDVINGVWVTVGEVARQAKVSRPTARKYLDMAVDQGAAHRFRPRGKGAVYYRPIEIVEG